MSFILEQLKKSGKKRELELALLSKSDAPGEKEAVKIPPLYSTPALKQSMPGRRAYLLALLAVALLSGLGGFLLSWNKAAVRPPAAGGRPVQAPPVAAAPMQHETVPQKPETLPGKADVPGSGVSIKQEKDQPSTGDSSRRLPDRKPGPAASWYADPGPQTPSHPADHGTAAGAALPEKTEPQRETFAGLPYIQELPSAQRTALPPVRITSHLYRGNSRLVSINGKIMSEGVALDDGLFLEKIIPEGVVLSFRGQRFRVRAD